MPHPSGSCWISCSYDCPILLAHVESHVPMIAPSFWLMLNLMFLWLPHPSGSCWISCSYDCLILLAHVESHVPMVAPSFWLMLNLMFLWLSGLFGFLIFWLGAYPMTVISEMCCAHSIRYLHFFFTRIFTLYCSFFILYFCSS
jgi:hypothetical protein